MAAFATAFLSL